MRADYPIAPTLDDIIRILEAARDHRIRIDRAHLPDHGNLPDTGHFPDTG